MNSAQAPRFQREEAIHLLTLSREITRRPFINCNLKNGGRLSDLSARRHFNGEGEVRGISEDKSEVRYLQFASFRIFSQNKVTGRENG